MKVSQKIFTKQDLWKTKSTEASSEKVGLVFVFGSTKLLKEQELINEISIEYPNAILVGCSTAGEIFDTEVYDDSIIITAVEFSKTTIKTVSINIEDSLSSFEAGKILASSLEHSNLNHVFVLSNGLKINGSDLVKGLTEFLPQNVTVTGGLAGDGIRFEETLVLKDNIPSSDIITLLGFYGTSLKVGFGSMGGWDPFGPERLITRSKENVLYELDGQNALELYKQYLGENSKGLPATGLLFPLSLRNQNSPKGLVRTILSIDEENQSITFAGDLPEGCYVRLMKANFDRLIDGAIGAANLSKFEENTSSHQLALLVSCVGRKLVLKQRIEEELEGVKDVFGDNTFLTGFYSYGEISPFKNGEKCELHNQTMTITLLKED